MVIALKWLIYYKCLQYVWPGKCLNCPNSCIAVHITPTVPCDKWQNSYLLFDFCSKIICSCAYKSVNVCSCFSCDFPVFGKFRCPFFGFDWAYNIWYDLLIYVRVRKIFFQWNRKIMMHFNLYYNMKWLKCLRLRVKTFGDFNWIDDSVLTILIQSNFRIPLNRNFFSLAGFTQKFIYFSDKYFSDINLCSPWCQKCNSVFLA